MKHRLSYTPERRCWANIKQRCYNKKNPMYHQYGGRGIKLYKPWINNFKLFYEYIISLPDHGVKGYTLDRENNEGNYEPGNLRWADWKTQMNNRRERTLGLRKSLIDYLKHNEKVTQQELADVFNVHQSTISRILKDI